MDNELFLLLEFRYNGWKITPLKQMRAYSLGSNPNSIQRRAINHKTHPLSYYTILEALPIPNNCS